MIELFVQSSAFSRVELGEICEVRGGYPAPQTDSAFECGEIPFVRMKDVGRWHFTNNLCKTEQKLNMTHFSAGRYELTPKGSILMPRSGSVGLNHRAILTVDAVVVSHLCALLPKAEKVDVSYLYHFLCCVDMGKLTKKTTGLDSIAFSDLKQVSIPLPSLPEQRRIAAILDQADALRAKRREALAQLDSLTQSIFIEMFGDPVTNPMGWPVTTLEHFFQFRTGKLDSNAAVPDGAYPFFTCAKEDYRIDSYAFDCEALLLAGNNANADYSVKHYSGKFNAYQRTYVITLKNPENSYQYSAYFLENHLAVLKRVSKGSSTKYLTLGLLNNIRIPVPPPTLQRRLGEKIQALNQLRASHVKSQIELESLFSSLQHRAFQGVL